MLLPAGNISRKSWLCCSWYPHSKMQGWLEGRTGEENGGSTDSPSTYSVPGACPRGVVSPTLLEAHGSPMHSLAQTHIAHWFVVGCVQGGCFPGSSVENPPAMWETWLPFLGREDPLEKEMATHSSNLAWRIPWIEEPGGLQSMGLQRV